MNFGVVAFEPNDHTISVQLLRLHMQLSTKFFACLGKDGLFPGASTDQYPFSMSNKDLARHLMAISPNLSTAKSPFRGYRDCKVTRSYISNGHKATTYDGPDASMIPRRLAISKPP